MGSGNCGQIPINSVAKRTGIGDAVLNADDSCFPIWEALSNGCQIIGFGLSSAQAEAPGDWRPTAHGGRLAIQSPWGALDIALALGMPASVIVAGLSAMQPVKGRLQHRRGLRGARLIDDSYNANPSLLDAALAVLTETGEEKVLVLGDMAELGEAAVEWYVQAGRSTRAAGVDRLFALGELSRHTVTFGARCAPFQ